MGTPHFSGWWRHVYTYTDPGQEIMTPATSEPWPDVAFDEGRYIYLGDSWDELYDPDRCGVVCDAVLRGDGSGRVLRGRNRNQAVRFPNGDIEIVPGARLRRADR